MKRINTTTNKVEDAEALNWLYNYITVNRELISTLLIARENNKRPMEIYKEYVNSVNIHIPFIKFSPLMRVVGIRVVKRYNKQYCVLA